jgi:hypothetical protein
MEYAGKLFIHNTIPLNLPGRYAEQFCRFCLASVCLFQRIQNFVFLNDFYSRKEVVCYMGGIFCLYRLFSYIYRKVLRAKMILLAADGLTNDEISRRLNTAGGCKHVEKTFF